MQINDTPNIGQNKKVAIWHLGFLFISVSPKSPNRKQFLSKWLIFFTLGAMCYFYCIVVVISTKVGIWVNRTLPTYNTPYYSRATPTLTILLTSFHPNNSFSLHEHGGQKGGKFHNTQWKIISQQFSNPSFCSLWKKGIYETFSLLATVTQLSLIFNRRHTFVIINDVGKIKPES